MACKLHSTLPPLPEQHAIATFLDREIGEGSTRLIAKVREAIGRLRELRTALIFAAVTGRIDVREEATMNVDVSERAFEERDRGVPAPAHTRGA